MADASRLLDSGSWLLFPHLRRLSAIDYSPRRARARGEPAKGSDRFGETWGEGVPATDSETIAVAFTGRGENVAGSDGDPKPVKCVRGQFERIEVFFKFDPQ